MPPTQVVPFPLAKTNSASQFTFTITRAQIQQIYDISRDFFALDCLVIPHPFGHYYLQTGNEMREGFADYDQVTLAVLRNFEVMRTSDIPLPQHLAIMTVPQEPNRSELLVTETRIVEKAAAQVKQQIGSTWIDPSKIHFFPQRIHLFS